MNKDKRFMLFGVILLLMSLVGSLGTYAWFTWKSTSNTSLTMTIGKLADVIFTSGNNISTSTLSPVYNYTDGEEQHLVLIIRIQQGLLLIMLLN